MLDAIGDHMQSERRCLDPRLRFCRAVGLAGHQSEPGIASPHSARMEDRAVERFASQAVAAGMARLRVCASQ